jgi:hypothetical protein
MIAGIAHTMPFAFAAAFSIFMTIEKALTRNFRHGIL